MNYQNFLDILEDIAPRSLAEEWDNPGIQIHTGKDDVYAVLVCLDVTPEVVEEAIGEGVDVIVAHHPLFFLGAKGFDERIPGQKKVLDLIREDIGVVASHTNFDTAPGGNNDFLADLIGLSRVETMTENGVPTSLVTGHLPEPMTLQELFLHIREMLALAKGQIRAAGDPRTIIEKAAVCTGAGSEFLQRAKEEGCQVLITGDVKHHEALEAAEMGMAIIDAGHYGTEKFFIGNMAEQLRERAGSELTVLESTVITDPFMV